MSHLRKPIHKLREPFGKAGLTVAILALVLAMVGGAYAAGGLSKSQEKQVKKIAKKFAGKPGAAGTNGTNGTNGPAGAKGASGEPGEPGAPGAPGAEGSPWTVGGTLPHGKSLSGTWSVGGAGPSTPTSRDYAASSISFGIPVSPAPTLADFVSALGIGFFALPNGELEVVNEEQIEAACPGSAAEPLAEPGFLCVFTKEEHKMVLNTNLLGPAFAPSKQGASLFFETNGEEAEAYARGTWAVTAP